MTAKNKLDDEETENESLLPFLIDRYGLRLTTIDFADLFKTTQTGIINKIRNGSFSIPTVVDNFKQNYYSADVRDVSKYLDDTRPGIKDDRKENNIDPQSYMSWQEKRQFVFERDDYTCQYCGEKSQIIECDHVIPKSRGGTNNVENLKTACWTCNRSKGSRLLSEWRVPNTKTN